MIARAWTARDRRQYVLLTRTFFSRMFESDLMPAGLPQVRLVISAVAAIAMPLTFLPVSMRLSGALMLFVQYTLVMIALAFIALIIWEGIFPDRRDGRILSALPIRTRTFVLSRLSAVAMLFAVVAGGGTALPIVAFIPIGNPVAHLAGFIGIASFAFFAIVGLQCIVLNVAGRAAAQRLAILLQIVMVVTVLQALTVVPPEYLFTGDARTPPTGVARWLPSIWFIGVHEVVAGRGNAASLALAAAGAAGAIGVPLVTVLLYGATYRRLVRRAIEGESAATPRSAPALAGAALKRLVAHAIPTPVARAICFFVLQTLARSRRHKMLLAMYLGVALALVLSIVVPRAAQKGWEGFARPDAALLTAPLVATFLSLIGFRAMIAIPIEIKANWIFRLLEPRRRAAAIGGLVAAMAVAGILPIALLGLAAAWTLWGPAVAVPHTVFSAALGVLLAQVLVCPLDRLPFTCTYLPGASRLKYLWPLYLLVLPPLTYSLGAYQALTLRRGGTLVVETLLALAAAAGFVVLRHLRLRRSPGFCFEGEDPSAIFGGFRLSEALAAEHARRTP